MPSHEIARGGHYGGADVSAALNELAVWFANGRIAVERVRHAMLGHGCAAPAPRCWPHHFDLATLTSFFLPRPATTAYVGAGLSPGDRYYDEPYFYLSVYPAPDPSALPPLPPLGHWHVEDFTGAVATATAILAPRGLKRRPTPSSPPLSKRRWRCAVERSCGARMPCSALKPRRATPLPPPPARRRDDLDRFAGRQHGLRAAG